MDTLQLHEEAKIIYKIIYPEYFNDKSKQYILKLSGHINKKDQLLDDINETFKELDWPIKVFFIDNNYIEKDNSYTAIYYSSLTVCLNGWDWLIVFNVLIRQLQLNPSKLASDIVTSFLQSTMQSDDFAFISKEFPEKAFAQIYKIYG